MTHDLEIGELCFLPHPVKIRKCESHDLTDDIASNAFLSNETALLYVGKCSKGPASTTDYIFVSDGLTFYKIRKAWCRNLIRFNEHELCR